MRRTLYVAGATASIALMAAGVVAGSTFVALAGAAALLLTAFVLAGRPTRER